MSDGTPADDRVGSAPPLGDEEITREQLLEWYRMMSVIRRVEELAAKAYTLKKILGFCHLYIGMEAVAVGTAAALRPSDYMVTAYREHGQILARGADPKRVMAELFGKGEGVSRGIGGSMHLVSAEHNFWGGYGIVGGHVPLAAGGAFASKYRGDDRVSVAFFGDGAAQQGAVFEALAMAQLWKLPAVFLCENNYYAMGTSIDRQSYLHDMSRRGDGVGMTRWQFEGFDVYDVYRNVKAAVEHARSGKGPVILEAVTYRYRGHSMSDPAKYRKAGELEEQKESNDCLVLAANRLRRDFGVTDDELKAIKKDIRAIAKEAYEFADQAEEPPIEDLYAYTYAE
jgi:pyruvate dehydrogenase E1 component alpha subunit